MGGIRQEIEFWALKPIGAYFDLTTERTRFRTVVLTDEGLLCTNLSHGGPVYFDLMFGSEIINSIHAMPLYTIEPADLMVLQSAFPLEDWDEPSLEPEEC